MIDRNNLRWHRDAIIYQLHLKSFFDANNAGNGDVGGLTQKLDYSKDLGARLQETFYKRPRTPILRVDGPKGS